jgi:hypothetical protein
MASLGIAAAHSVDPDPPDTTEVIERQCPRLTAEGYEVTSPQSIGYNCVAWALGEDDRWWEPVRGYFWPLDLPQDDALDTYIRIFELAGYVRCESVVLETGYERVAVYVDDAGAFAHVAKQRDNGRWTSKISYFEDIDHPAAESLLGAAFTRIAAVLRRVRQSFPIAG